MREVWSACPYGVFPQNLKYFRSSSVKIYPPAANITIDYPKTWENQVEYNFPGKFSNNPMTAYSGIF